MSGPPTTTTTTTTSEPVLAFSVAQYWYIFVAVPASIAFLTGLAYFCVFFADWICEHCCCCCCCCEDDSDDRTRRAPLVSEDGSTERDWVPSDWVAEGQQGGAPLPAANVPMLQSAVLGELRRTGEFVQSGPVEALPAPVGTSGAYHRNPQFLPQIDSAPYGQGEYAANTAEDRHPMSRVKEE